MLSLLPQLLVSGIAIGMLYALIALSMTILYRATTVVNFGHGDLVMAGAYMVLIFVINATLPFLPRPAPLPRRAVRLRLPPAPRPSSGRSSAARISASR